MGEKEDKKLARSWTAKKLKKLRESLAMNQEEFGKLFSKTSRVVSRWEGGSSKPVIEALRDIDVLARDRDEQVGVGIPRLSIVEGDLLDYVTAHPSISLNQLIRSLNWQPCIITMGVGLLIREGLVQVTEHGNDVLIKAR